MGQLTMTFSPVFLECLDRRCENASLPILLGGIFNLIRFSSDKSSGGGDKRLMDLFNGFIEKHELKEIRRVWGSKYTWTNKQATPIMSNIDRVLVSTDWEDKFPLTTLNTLVRVGSDHNPLLLDTGKRRCIQPGRFFFEKQWCLEG